MKYLIPLLIILSASCSRKTTEAITTTVKVDSSSVVELRTRNEVLKDSVYILKTKLTTVTKQLATTLTGETGINDTASRLPMQSRTLNVGNSQIHLKGRWEYLNYMVHIGEVESIESYQNDVIGFYIDRLTEAYDSIAQIHDSHLQEKTITSITKEPGFFERLLIGFKMYWWLLIACFLLGAGGMWYLKR